MTLTIASALLSDRDFVAALHAGDLPLTSFHHGDHLRFAWIALHTPSFRDALDLVRTGIRRFAANHGVPHIYHETLTMAWVHLLASHDEESFALFLRNHEQRLGRDLLYAFWSPEVLGSPTARAGWVSPDRAALPRHAQCCTDARP